MKYLGSLESFFSNIVSNLKIEGYSNCEPLANNIRDPVLKCILKYRNHPSTLAIGEVYNNSRRLPFSFSKATSKSLPRHRYSYKNRQRKCRYIC